MSMVINTNISALNTVNQLNKNNSLMNSSLEKLSSGYQINSAADDAAGLAISEKMRGQIRGLDQASDNAQDAISLTQTADGALDETSSILQRMRELAVQSSSDSLTDDDRESIQDEVDQLRQEIDRISDDTEYNTKKLLNGSLSSTVNVTGTNSSAVILASTVAGAGTTSGTYSVVVTTAATQATVATTASATVTTATDALSSTYVGKTVEINDSTISISDGDTLEGLVNKINSITSDTNVSATLATDTSGKYYVSLATTGYGSDSEISITADNGVLSDLFASTAADADATITNVTATGTDIAGTINGIAATGSANTLTAADGLTVTFKDGTAASSTVDVVVDTSNTLTFQIGANEDQTMSLSIGNMSAYSLGVATDDTGTDGLDMTTAASASAAITTIDAAINKVSAERAKLGATENRLEHTINNLSATSENITAAESNIRDVDMASEMANYTKLSVLTQAATAMLAQANQQPQQVLKLLQ